ALSNGDTSRNAKRALLYHILPMISLGLSTVLFSIYNNNHSSVMFILAIIFIIAVPFYMLKNLYLGIKVLISEK
ncbi:hypothetical protein, partial [Staphylococcus pseudintermedius]